MITFAWIYLFLLLPLPLLVYKLLPESSFGQERALCVPELGDFKRFQRIRANRGWLIPFLAICTWLSLLTAAARPQWVGEWVEIPRSGRDLMMAVDLSGSMAMKDFELGGHVIDRIGALKVIATDFISRRKGDRIGLILFGSQAYLHTPLTFDTGTVSQLLNESVVGLAGKETAIGDAIGLAIKHLRDSAEKARVLILLTDGNNNAGALSIEKAAEIASHTNIKIHTIAIGADEMLVQSLFGTRRVNPSSELDEKALRLVAEKTGGEYFRAYNTKDLARIYQHIDRLEPIDQDNEVYRPVDEMYWVPLIGALAFCFLLFIALRGKR